MTEANQTTLWIGAFRYYIGRRSYAVGVFVDLLMAEWAGLPLSCRALIQRETEEEIKRDNNARANHAGYLPLGDDCDRADWLRLRALWTRKSAQDDIQ